MVTGRPSLQLTALHALDDCALTFASLKGHTATVALLLDRGAHVHAVDDEALHNASRNGHTATVRLLLHPSPSIMEHLSYTNRVHYG
jgi:ankyrin repeat protein